MGRGRKAHRCIYKIFITIHNPFNKKKKKERNAKKLVKTCKTWLLMFFKILILEIFNRFGLHRCKINGKLILHFYYTLKWCTYNKSIIDQNIGKLQQRMFTSSLPHLFELRFPI